ncbi:efflux RND transporter permease subunit [Treponema primitia]|uniref:efflux RND transporter permease subunit n=1 Tax=Treponema primitia TaxID=88058 RepID=UPI00025555C7|nr:efflux RND transporter permease subunit [Treponema primitia]
MSMAKMAVGRPTTIFIIFALLIGLGVFAMVNMPIDLLPEINPPYLIVYTSYPGAGPEEVERSVTRTLEAALSSVSALEELTSTSSKGTSMVIMEFTYGTDLADAANSVRDALERIRNYMPTGADTPMMFKMDPSMLPIMGLQVTGNRSPEELREISEDTIIPRIEQTPGVATASINGGREKIIRVEVSQNRLEAYGLTVTQIQQMLAGNNAQVSAGSITEGGMNYILTTMGEYTSLEQIRNTVISYKGGGVVNGQVEMPRTIYLRDIADVFEGYKSQESVVLVNGQPSVMLMVQKQSGKNSVQTAKELRARLVKIAGELPQDIKITENFNTTDQIENSLNEVTSSALSGAALAIIVLFIFLRSIKPTLIIGISIPVSIVVTIMLMYFLGLTLNLMTMAGLVLGIGMLVDNSVVILENIYHYREKGAKLQPAAILGTSEMIVAIAASTLTTICVFAPLVMFQGLLEMAGEMFAGLAFTVVISLTISLLVAIFLVPVLGSHYFPLVTRKQKPLSNRFLASIDKAFENFFTGLDNAYRKAVDRVLRHKAIVIGFLVLLFAGSIMLIPKIGWVFMPEQDADSVSITATLPMGTPLVETEATLQKMQLIVQREVQGYDRIVLNAGGGNMFGGSSTNSGSLRINLPDFEQRIDSAENIKTKMRAHFNEFPGVSFSFSGGGFGGGGGMGGSSPAVDIILRTDDLVKGKVLAEQIAQLLRDNVPEVKEPQVSLKDGLPQIEIELDRDRIYSMGLNAYTIGNEIKAAVDGITATRYKDNGINYDVVLVLAEADRSTRPALDHIFVNSQMSGGRVPLSNFATYKEGTGPMSINRENQSRVIHITASGAPGAKLNTLDEKVRNLVQSSIPADEDVVIEYGGGNSEMMKMMGNFLLIVAVAIFLVFGVMASLFESFKDPFIVILTIPLSLIGVVAIYFISGDVFNILTAVGLLVLVGVIVNNGIVLVDYTNLLRKRGYSLHDACVEAAGNRLRPILMTTLTTILGLAPMAFVPGEGSVMTAPIGKTVLGGLAFGTLMTLFLMPTVYYIMNRHSDEQAARAEARRNRIAQGLTRRQAKAQNAARTALEILPDSKIQTQEAGV